jgi:iron complex transport system permease protein
MAAGVFALCMFVSGRVGGVGIDWGLPADPFALEFRMQRVIAAAMVGFALAAAGVALQALLRNPLADPYVLGISSGSTVGVMIWLLAGRTILLAWFTSAAPLLLSMGRSVPAVLGAVVTCVVVFALSRSRSGGMQPVTLLLVGVVISSVNAAILMVLNSLAPQGVLSNFALFMLGSISEGQLTRPLLLVALAVLLAGYLPTLLSAAALNIGTFSDAEATSLGVNIQRLRTLSFVCASVMTGAAILLSGPIGFVGLICPHICRRLKVLGGADHRTLLIAAPLCGAAFLMLADSAVRVAATLNKGTFPVGVVTALCGGPFFLFLLRRYKDASQHTAQIMLQ